MRQSLIAKTFIVCCLLLPATSFAADPVAVPTYQSIGLYWKAAAPASGGDDAKLEFRISGKTTWKEALPLWFDKRNAEYRGSIVHLAPGRKYDIRISLDNGTTQTLSATTWKDTPPIAKTVELPVNSNGTLTITQGGTPSGYVLYTAAPGSTATIDVKRNADYNVIVKADYVIIRGLTLKGAKKHAINIGNTNTASSTRRGIVIERNDISGWGSVSPDNPKWGRNLDSGVFASAPTSVYELTIQRNRIHHPNYASNSWEEKHKTYHPQGPQPITLRNMKSGLVVRYNEIYSDANHYFNDGMGGTNNFSATGFPVQDADIYGNFISHVRDNAIEAEGGNRNVRIWANYIDKVYSPFGFAPIKDGPLYVWRNLSYSTSSGPKNSINSSWLKTRNYNGGQSTDWGGGRLYLFNNTALIPKSGDGTTVFNFMNEVSDRDRLRNIRTLNNIMQVQSIGYSIKESAAQNVSFDYDLLAGKTKFSSPQERNGVRAKPQLAEGWGLSPETMKGRFQLETASPGYDSAVRIPNFLSAWTGRGPDMGAHEALAASMQFGVNAYAGNSEPALDDDEVGLPLEEPDPVEETPPVDDGSTPPSEEAPPSDGSTTPPTTEETTPPTETPPAEGGTTTSGETPTAAGETTDSGTGTGTVPPEGSTTTTETPPSETTS